MDKLNKNISQNWIIPFSWDIVNARFEKLKSMQYQASCCILFQRLQSADVYSDSKICYHAICFQMDKLNWKYLIESSYHIFVRYIWEPKVMYHLHYSV